MNWFYEQPVKIFFGSNTIAMLPKLVKNRRVLLVTSSYFTKSGIVENISKMLGYCEIFDGVTPNPDADDVNLCSDIVRKEKIECIVSLGGGSVTDLAKASSLGARDIREYMNGKTIDKKGIPLISVPTTAGTGSEVTCVAVISDRKKGQKMPVVSEGFYPEYALVDPVLTYSLPPRITAVSGIDVLCHAIEGYSSKNHQPICDVFACHAAKLVFENLPHAYMNGNDKTARENMAQASLIAGLAFTQPKTTAPHACSFPLTTLYGIPHGEACALTLDYFIRINASDKRTERLAVELGFKDVNEFADRIHDFKEELDLRTGLYDMNLTEKDVQILVEKSRHPNIYNNPVEITDVMLKTIYSELKERR